MPRQVRRRRTPEAGTRERLFAAAAAEFAARGFAGANVDRIADAAGVNKAMLYYHFDSKASLYGEVLRDMFQAVADRLAARTAPGADPADRIRTLVEVIAQEALARPHFPPIWLREIAEGGAHVDRDTMAVVGRILQHVFVAVEEGVKARRFRPVQPLLVQLGIVGPLLMFFATAPLRRKAPPGMARAVDLPVDEVIAHVQRVALLTLEAKR
ncbi:MAG TPA: TetR/AcrR family transcriptional regulator [Vicinamibacterales bacterium]|nr:TetR/AcrR family transcriptional regulator [Vicinamibacterales bacterium]